MELKDMSPIERDLKLVITAHALAQFQRRYARLNTADPELPYPTIELRQMVVQAEFEQLPKVVRVKRLINNNGNLAEYFRYQDWRFVIKEDNGILYLLTAELNEY